MSERKPYSSDVSDDEWAFVAPYLTLMTEDAPQREHPLRQVFNGLRSGVRGGIAWRMMPNDLPPWYTVYQQTQRWLKANVFEAMAHDLREVLRLTAGRHAQPSAAIFDSRMLQSSPESGERAGDDGAKRRKGSQTYMAVDTLGHLLTLYVTAANEQDRAHVAQLAQEVQDVTGQRVEIVFVDQGYTGDDATQAAAAQGIRLMVVTLPDAKKGFELLHAVGWSHAPLAGRLVSVALPVTMSVCLIPLPFLACFSFLPLRNPILSYVPRFYRATLDAVSTFSLNMQ